MRKVTGNRPRFLGALIIVTAIVAIAAIACGGETVVVETVIVTE